MRSIKRAEEMSPAERRREVATILADGFLRLRARRGYVPPAEPDVSSASDSTEESSRDSTF